MAEITDRADGVVEFKFEASYETKTYTLTVAAKSPTTLARDVFALSAEKMFAGWVEEKIALTDPGIVSYVAGLMHGAGMQIAVTPMVTVRSAPELVARGPLSFEVE